MGMSDGKLSVTSAALTLERRITELESQVEQLRGLLKELRIGAAHESCAFSDADPDPTWHCCDWSEIVEKIDRALGVDDNV